MLNTLGSNAVSAWAEMAQGCGAGLGVCDREATEFVRAVGRSTEFELPER
jgi:hypothetical protein